MPVKAERVCCVRVNTTSKSMLPTTRGHGNKFSLFSQYFFIIIITFLCCKRTFHYTARQSETFRISSCYKGHHDMNYCLTGRQLSYIIIQNVPTWSYKSFRECLFIFVHGPRFLPSTEMTSVKIRISHFRVSLL